MATNALTDANIPQQSPAMSSVPPEPCRSAPPVMQQSVPHTEDEVVWDDSMMDVDDSDEVPPVVQTLQVVESTNQDVQTSEIDPSQVRSEAVHLRGVDSLSTDDVRLYVSTLYPSFEFIIEWIDDTSLNVVYESAEIATTALQTLSSPYIEELPPSVLRPAKSLTGEKPIDGLKARIAFIKDKKERGARDRSRWYLFNPHPSEEYERRRDSRRRVQRRYDPYSRRRRSRSKSPILNYDDVPRNEGVELFPSKVSNGARTTRSQIGSRPRSPGDRRRIKESHPVFTSLINTISSNQSKESSHVEEMEDLFPSKAESLGRAAMDSPLSVAPRKPSSSHNIFLQDPVAPVHEVNLLNDSNPIELFPDKIPKSLDEQSTGKSLAERIQDGGDGGTKDLFPGILQHGGGRRRRRKAEDHF